MLDGVGKCQTSKVIGSLNIHDGLNQSKMGIIFHVSAHTIDLFQNKKIVIVVVVIINAICLFI